MVDSAKWNIIWSNNEFVSLSQLKHERCGKITVEDHLKIRPTEKTLGLQYKVSKEKEKNAT